MAFKCAFGSTLDCKWSWHDRLNNHWATLRTILALLGLILGLPGSMLTPWGIILAGLGLHFGGPGATHGHIFFIWQRFY